MSLQRRIASLLPGLLLLLAAEAGFAAVDVEVRHDCVDGPALQAQLSQVMAQQSQAREIDLLVTVTDVSQGTSTKLVLSGIAGDGEVILQRSFLLSQADCDSAVELLSTVLGRFVRELPLERWTLGPQPVTPPKPPLPAPAAAAQGFAVELGARLGADLLLAPLGADAGASLTADIGQQTHALGLEGSVVVSYPSDLGPGNFYTVIAMGGAGWRYNSEPWLLRLVARAGAILVAGSGFESNENEWLPWVELWAGFGRRFGPIHLLVTAALSPFRHTAVTVDKSLSRTMSNVRLGIAVEIPMWGKEF